MSGKLRVKLPPGRHGFRVFSDYGEVLDLGTEFAVKATKDEFFVYVYEGRVSYSGKYAQKKLLKKGEFFSYRKGLPVTKLKSDHLQYKSVDELQKLNDGQVNARLLAWRLYQEEMKKDEKLAFLYNFQKDAYDSNFLRQAVYRGEASPSNGTILGAEWGAGRWPGVDSLHFSRPSDRVKMLIDEKFSKMTLNLWVRFDEIRPDHHHAVLLSEKFEPFEFTLQLVSLAPGIRLKLHSRSNINHFSEVIPRQQLMKKWNLITLTLDTRKNVTAIYLNGELSTQVQHKNDIKPLYFGWCDLMNWVPIQEHDFRNSPGRVDFLAIHRRVLTPKTNPRTLQHLPPRLKFLGLCS